MTQTERALTGGDLTAPAPPPGGRSRGRRWGGGRVPASHWAVAALLYCFFAVFLIWPIVQVVSTGFWSAKTGFTLDYFRLVFADPLLRAGMANAVIVALLVTLATVIVSLPLAVLSVRYEFKGRALLAGLLLVPLVLPPFVGAIGMRLVFGRFGPLTQIAGAVASVFGNQSIRDAGIDWLGRYKLVGIVIIEVLHLYPIMLLNLQAALANIDPAMEQAAANIGAGRWTIFRRITLPMMRPGLFAGCTLVLIWSFTELGTPLMFDFYTITPVQIYQRITDIAGNPLPYALVVVMLLGSSLLYVGGKIILGRGFEASATKASVASATRKLRGMKGALAAAPFVVITILALLPHLAVLLTSMTATGAWYKSVLPAAITTSHYANAMVDDLVLPSVLRSMQYASLATALAVAVGMCVAWIVVRSNVPGRSIIDALSMLPLAVPGLVLAFGYLAISVWLKQKAGANLTGSGKILSFLDVQENPLVLLVIAYAARRLPYVVRATVAGLEQTPRDLELAASNLGAPRRTVLGRITVPLILANLIAGGLLAFAFAMLEVSDSLLLAQRRDYFPITRAIWELSQRLGDGLYIASALGVWAMLFLTCTILAANSLLGKKLGAVFRV